MGAETFVASDEGEVFRQILARLKTVLTVPGTLVSADMISLRAVPNVEGILNSPAVQLIPGPANVVDGRSGAARVDQSCEVVIFYHGLLDRPGEDDIRFMDPAVAEGLIEIRNKVRGDGAGNTPTGLIHHVSVAESGSDPDAVHTPMELFAFSGATINPRDQNWIQTSDSFRFRWKPYDL